MFTIRTEQLAAFDRADTPEFAGHMEGHLREAFPKHSDFLGNEGLSQVIRYGVEQGRALGFSTCSPVGLFIDLTLLLGRDFHQDPQLGWARYILEDRAFIPDELMRAERLHGAAIEYLDSVSGPDNEFIDAAQKRILCEDLTSQTGAADAFIADASVRLERIWPEKFKRLDEAARTELMRLGVRKALQYRAGSEPGALLCIGMMFMLGSGFDQDPMFGWSHKILTSNEPAATKIAGLHAAALAYLNRWCGGEGACHV